MRVLVVGNGGVGSAFARIARRRSFYECMVLADLDLVRPQAVVGSLGEHDRFGSAGLDASDEDAIVRLIADEKADAVLNATDPRFNPQIFDACLRSRATYLDIAMTLSEPHPVHPHEETHVKLGDYQFAQEGTGSRKDCSHSSGSASSPAQPTSSPVMQQTSSSPRSTRSGSGTARTSSSRATTSRRPSPSGRPSRSASTHP